MLFCPFVPPCIVRIDQRQDLVEVLAGDAVEPVAVRVPHAHRFPVIENEGVLVGPPRGGQGQFPAVQRAAVHSRQVNQRSVGCRYRLISDTAVGNLMTIESRH